MNISVWKYYFLSISNLLFGLKLNKNWIKIKYSWSHSRETLAIHHLLNNNFYSLLFLSYILLLNKIFHKNNKNISTKNILNRENWASAVASTCNHNYVSWLSSWMLIGPKYWPPSLLENKLYLAALLAA